MFDNVRGSPAIRQRADPFGEPVDQRGPETLRELPQKVPLEVGSPELAGTCGREGGGKELAAGELKTPTLADEHR